MEFEQWKGTYEEIISQFGYSRKKDRKAAELLSEVRGTDGLSPLRKLKDQVVEISGPYYSESRAELTVAAGSTIEMVEERGVDPDLIVTDLDGDIELQLRKNLNGIPAVIHAHEDNIDLIEEWSEKFEGHVISTCQCRPPENNIYNFGGFTDGDRAVHIADHFDAKKIKLNGWDFGNPYEGGIEKQKKLDWAKKLIDRVQTCVKEI